MSGGDEIEDPRAPVLEAFGVRVDHRELDKLRDLRGLVLNLHALICEGTRGPLRVDEWLEVVNAARAAMTPATFDPATGLDRTAFVWSTQPPVIDGVAFLRPLEPEVAAADPQAAAFNEALRLTVAGSPVRRANGRKHHIRERSDRRGLDVVEIEAWCQNELIKNAPGRYKIDSDGWLVDTMGGRK